MTAARTTPAPGRAPRNEREALAQLAAMLDEPMDRDARWERARRNVAAEEHAAALAAARTPPAAPIDPYATRRYPRSVEEAFPTPEWRAGFYGPYRRARGRALLIVAVVLAAFLAWGIYA